MSGLTSVSIIPRTTYDLAAVRDGIAMIPVAKRVDVSGAEGLALEIRIFDGRFPAGAEAVIRVASDGFTPDAPSVEFQQTKTSAGADIAALKVGPDTPMPSFATLSAPIEHVGRLMAVVIEFRGGTEGGPQLSLSIDAILRGAREFTLPKPDTATESLIEPIVTRPESEVALPQAAQRRITEAVGDAVAARAPRRYPRWREIVV